MLRAYIVIGLLMGVAAAASFGSAAFARERSSQKFGVALGVLLAVGAAAAFVCGGGLR